MATELDTTPSSASNGRTPTPRSSGRSASSPSNGTPTSTRTRRPRSASKEINEAYWCCPTRTAAPALRHVRRAGVGGPGEGDFRVQFRVPVGSATSSTFFGGATATRRGADGRRPVRTCATTCGSRSRRRPRDGEGDRLRGARHVRDVQRQRRQGPGRPPRPARNATGAAGYAPSVRRCARPDGQRVGVPALPGPRERIVENRCDTCQGEGRIERKRTESCIPAGIDEGHQIRLSGEGEVGPRAGAFAEQRCTRPSTSARIRR